MVPYGANASLMFTIIDRSYEFYAEKYGSFQLLQERGDSKIGRPEEAAIVGDKARKLPLQITACVIFYAKNEPSVQGTC